MQPQHRFTVPLALGLALAAGCAQSVGDIDRTQPNLLPKSMFDGTWFVRQTVVDVPETSLFSWIGETGDMELIRWEIQEDYLIGYRAYEQVPGADPSANPENEEIGGRDFREGFEEGRSGDAYRGNPIVAYEISDHVDVIRDYNTRTGEQSNVLTENTQDRPWHERDYMRVDWSKPAVNHWFFLSSADRENSSLSMYVQSDEQGDDAFRVCHQDDEECTDGRSRDREDHGDPYYVEFTERTFVNPSVTGCILDLNVLGAGDCSAQEIEVRTSFLKVDEARERDFVPIEYDDRRQGEFGYFRTERVTYDRRRGTTHQGVIYLANAYDMWSGSRDENGDPVPYAERGLRPITYHLSPDYPPEMLDVTDQMQAEYDRAFKDVAATRRRQSIEELEADLQEQTGDTCLFCVDRNEDSAARIGDLRYNFIYWVERPLNDFGIGGLLGYGPSNAHPETGRIVSGQAFVYGASVDRYATLAKDIVDLLNGDITEEEVQGAEYIREEIDSRRQPTDPREVARFDGISLDRASEEMLGADTLRRIESLREHGLPQSKPGWGQRRTDQIRGTALEPLLINDEIIAARGLSGGIDALTDDAIAELSPASWATPDAIKKVTQRRELAERHNVWLADFADPTISGLAQEVRDMGLTGDALWQYLRERIYRGVMLHEIGHTVGLRHNFASSSDALNYHDEYWPLRSQTIIETPGSVGDLARMNCALIDGSNQAACAAQEAGRMREFQYSSIMDYGAKFNSDFNGLGKYDRAALAAAYGNLVEVFDEEMVAGSVDSAARGVLRDAAAVRNPLFGQLNDAVHHTRYPALFSGYENIARRRWIPREDYAPDEDLRVPYAACYDEFADATPFCHRWDEGADQHEIAMHFVRTYREYYPFNNFQRDQLAFSPFNLLNRVLGRYFAPLLNLYQHFLFDFDGSNSIEQIYSELGGTEGFQLLAQVMAMPRYGSYALQDGAYRWQSYAMDRGEIAIPAGIGRRAFSTYDLDAGYNIFNRVLEAGAYWEQVAALVALVSNDASVLGIGADVTADFLTYSIPYYLIFSDEMNHLFGSIVNLDYASYAPRLTDDRRIVFPNYLAGRDGVPDTGTPIDLRTPFSIQINSLFYGMAFTPINFDLGFVQRGQISLLGTGQAITPASGFDATTFEDPFSGRVYVAYRSQSNPDDAWFGADRIDELNGLLADYNAAADDSPEKRDFERRMRGILEDLEIMRAMYDAFGKVL